MSEARRYAARFFLAWLCSFVFLLVIYFPTASIPFAHHDQYRYFSLCGPHVEEIKLERSSEPQWDWLRLIGRPVAAELEHQIFRHVTTVGDLTRIRIIGIGLYATAMAMFLVYLLEFNLTPRSAFCLAGAVFALPAVQFSVYVASFNHPVAHILALSSALLMRLGSRLSAGDARWYLNPRRIACHAVAIALLVIAQLSYPPSAFVALFLIATELALKGTADWPATCRHLVRDASLLVVACIVYYLIIKRYYLLRGGHGVHDYQIEMNVALLHRLHMFVTQLLWPMFNLWNVQVSIPLAKAVACCLASGLGVMLFRQLRHACRHARRIVRVSWNSSLIQASIQCTLPIQRLSRGLQLLGAIVLVLALSETTYFAAPAGWKLYRTHFASAGITLLMLAGAAAAWGRLVTPRWRGRLAMTLACATLCGAGLVAHHNVLMNCLNDRLELSFIGSQISAHLGDPIRRIHVIQAANERFTFNGHRIVFSGDEFNNPTTARAGAIGNMVRTALQVLFDRDSLQVCDVPHTLEAIQSAGSQAIAITYSAHGEPVVASPDTIVIDMDALLRVAASTTRPWHAAPPLSTASNPSRAAVSK